MTGTGLAWEAATAHGGLTEQPVEKYDLILVDGNNMARRMQFAHSDLSINVPGPEGTTRALPTGVPFGFVLQIIKLKKLGKEIAVCWDKGRKLRSKLFPAYKQHRVPLDPVHEEAYQEAMGHTRQLLTDLGVDQLYSPGHEADDVVFSKAKDAAAYNKERVAIVSNDYDFLQAVSGRIHVIASRKGQDVTYTRESFTAEYGFDPKHWLDVMSLCGDRTDNIPGVAGIGEKSAIEIVKADTSFVTRVIEGAGTPPAGLAKRLQTLAEKAVAEAEAVKLARELARLRYLKPVTEVTGKLDPKKVRQTLMWLNVQSVLTDREQWEVLVS